MTRNRLLVFLKNIPISLLFRNLHLFLTGQIWYGAAYQSIFASWEGYVSCLRILPSIIQDHRIIKKKRVISHEKIQSLLTYDKPQ